MLTDCRVHATIPAADLRRPRKWYAAKLGFEPIRGPTRSAWFRDSEGNIIGIVQLPPA